MLFEKTNTLFNTEPETFTEESAPSWLTSYRAVKGSTMDERWFWNDHVLTLDVGESVETDFTKITRKS
jgi:hypothetical protein